MTHCHTTKSRAYKSAKKPQVYAKVMVLVMGIKIQLKLLVVGFCVMSVVWMPTSATKRKVRKRFRILNGIVGGEETASNGYPWQARLEEKVRWCYQQMMGIGKKKFFLIEFLLNRFYPKNNWIYQAFLCGRWPQS